MKITRRQLRKLIFETIYVNPKGDAFDTTNDPGTPHMKAFHTHDAKKDFLDVQGGEYGEKIRSFSPDRLTHGIDSQGRTYFDKRQIAALNQGVGFADAVGDQGEFKPFGFSKDEEALRKFATDEMDKAHDAIEDGESYNDNTALYKGDPYYGGMTDYSGHINQLEHQMNVAIKKILKTTYYPEYWDVIGALKNVPGYKKLMNIISNKEGESGPNAEKLKKLPKKVANQHSVFL